MSYHLVSALSSDTYAQRLHSLEAQQRMKSYQIGRIEGRWTNLLPPIQGGKFRTYAESDEDDLDFGREEEEILSDSSKNSSVGSPMFDSVPDALSSLRYRQKSGGRSMGSSSATSLSSCDLDEPVSETWGSLLDACTKKELDIDIAKYPSLDLSTQADIVSKYRMLNQRIKAEGLYQCSYRSYLVELCRYIFIFTLTMMCLRWGWYGTCGMFMGIFWHQLVFTAHDAGHMGITHDFTTDTVIGIIIADFLGGLSLGWWKRNHNVHHIVTNSPEHDPDIEHMPIFAISHRFFDSLRSTYYDKIMTYDRFAKIMIRYQHYLFYPILTFGRFNLYILSWDYLIRGLGPRKGPAWWHRWLEIAGQVFFWTWFGYGLLYKSIPTAWGRFAFVMVSHMVTMPLHVQLTLSHFAMSTADLGVNESFPQRMLRTTMDVECPEWLDFFHGGLQFQAIHHLYPRIPRHNLRKTQKLVQDFCNDVGIPYALYGFVDGNKKVIGRLGDVGRQAAILAQCQSTIVENRAVGHH